MVKDDNGKPQVDFEELRKRFLAKYEKIPVEYHEALGWLYVYQKQQDNRKRVANRALQLTEGKRVFWVELVGSELARVMAEGMKVVHTKTGDVDVTTFMEKQEDYAAARIHACLAKTTWYRDVAVIAAHGFGMSDRSGTLTAAKILDAFGSPSRFATFGSVIRYARLAPENGKAPRPTRGAVVHYSPKAWQALYDLSESWLKMASCDWRQKWDAWKEVYRAKYPDEKTHPKMRIHQMGRRKVIREFLHELWDLWREWEANHAPVAVPPTPVSAAAP